MDSHSTSASSAAATPSSTAQRRAFWALTLLTALNFINYIDRSVLWGVQELVKREFPESDARFGMLTSVFIIFYMIAAPFIGPLADRYQRRVIMMIGGLLWSGATLLTAFTTSFNMLLFRHTIVGVGEATFVVIAPAFLSDMYPEKQRNRIFSIFYLAIPVGTAVGYLLGGYLSQFGFLGQPHLSGWRLPFLVCAAPGVVLSLLLMTVPEPRRGAQDHLTGTAERSTLLGLLHNRAFWTVSFGMAGMTFAVGGMQVWMPTFLERVRHIPLGTANFKFGLLTVLAGIVATLAGRFLGDFALKRTKGGYYLVSAIGLGLAVPAILFAVHAPGSLMFPAIFLGEFFILLNTAPLNAALVNSV
ncbi:MAG TPA: MFS transporter, partial [candidate division Zixibacteria bacterium]|nr:MFS transporter [candidate division Zixibacteria bacterium]